MEMPARLRALRAASTGPSPIMRGSMPEAPEATQRASGFRPSSRAFSALISSRAAAPSFSPEELPAVTVPFLRKAGFSRARASSEVSRRGRSSTQTMTGSPFFCGTGTGRISSSARPESMAAIARW